MRDDALIDKQLPPENVIGEPCKRDTAPAIGLAALLVLRDDPDAIMAVMPSDHLIEPAAAFQAAIEQAVGIVKSRPETLVTFGIKPTYPAESFGYIERGGSRGSGVVGLGSGVERRGLDRFRNGTG